MIRAGAVALISHWRRNPLQLLTLLGGLALATALWSAVQAINAEARASYAAAAATLGEGRYDQIVAADGGWIAQEDYIALRRAGWLVSPVVEGRIGDIRLVGIDPLTAPPGIGPVDPGAGDLSAFLSGAGQVFARPEALAALAGLGPDPVPAPDVAPGTALTDIGVAQRLLGREGGIDRLILSADQPRGRPPLDGIGPGLTLRPADSGNDLSRLTDSFHLNLTAFGLLSFAVGIFIVHGAVGLAFAQRRPMVRVLRALGMPLRMVLALMAGEMALFALLAGAAGVALGYLVAAALLPDVALSLRGLYGAEVSGTLAFRPVWALSGLAIALGGAALAAGRALWQVARMPLLAANAPQALAARARWARMAALSTLLLAAALVLGLTGIGLTAGFALLACLLIGAALALPPLLSLILRLAAQAARGPVAEWFWADSRQQLPALSLALMALMLAMATNTGVSTMVSSFRLTFTAFLDQRLSSELYVTTTDAGEAARLAAFAATRADAVLPLLAVNRPLAGLPGELYGMRDHATYRDNWRFLDALPGAWDLVAAGEAVIVNEQLARRAGLSPGDPLDVGVTLPVAGIYGDYGNPVGQAVVAEALFASLHPEAPALRFGLRTADPEGLSAALTRELGLPPAAITDQAAIKGFSMGVFERTFAVTGALNLLTLAVAGFAMLMSLLTLATMRLPQLAPVWALGLTRRGLARAEFARALALAALTGVLALPVGLLLAWALLAVVNVAAFGWKLPLHLFPLDWLRLFALTLAAAALAAALPALRLRRMPPARLLKVFADER